MKILIIEDEIPLADSLRDFLRGEGFEVECAYNGADGAAFAETGIYDLLILEAMLPGMDGYEVARTVREAHCGTPIMMLTAKAEPEDEIEGLNAGADYYLTKPLDSGKLLACVHALLRRQGTRVNELVVGKTTLNLSNSTLVCGEYQERLSAREFEVMRFLMSSEGKIVPKELILCRVWGFDSNAVENHVEVYVGMLRKKLKRVNSNVRINAIRRLGYILEIDQA